MSAYEPGTVATILVDGNELTGLATGDGWMYSDACGAGHLTFEQVSVARPLVVLDLPQRSGFITALKDAEVRAPDVHLAPLLEIREQIEAQTRPPKPPEPTGLGAVVKDREGNRWVKPGGPNDGRSWYCADTNGAMSTYTAIDVVEVLSEGVS